MFFLCQYESLRCLISRAYLIFICNVTEEYERMIFKKRNKEMFDHSTSTYSTCYIIQVLTIQAVRDATSMQHSDAQCQL